MGGKASRRVARNAKRKTANAAQAAFQRVAEKVQLASANRARHRDMLTLAQEALTLAQQVEIVPVPEDHDPADGDPNAVRDHEIRECEKKVEISRELLYASTMDLHDLLSSVDTDEGGDSGIEVVPANALPTARS